MSTDFGYLEVADIVKWTTRQERKMKIVVNGPAEAAEVPGLSEVASEVDLVCAQDRDQLAEIYPEFAGARIGGG